jgi:hypothetical protein
MVPHALSEVSDDTGYTPKSFEGGFGIHVIHQQKEEPHNIKSAFESNISNHLKEQTYVWHLSDNEKREIEESVSSFLGMI